MSIHQLARIALIAVVIVISTGLAHAGETPTVEEQLAGLDRMCAESEGARVARHEAKPLYFRLGEYDKIHELTIEIARLHSLNPDFDRFWSHIDEERLAKNVADFVSTGTGGPAAGRPDSASYTPFATRVQGYGGGVRGSRNDQPLALRIRAPCVKSHRPSRRHVL